MESKDQSSVRRIEMILQQVEALPTLPGVAMRLLQVTRADDSNAREVVELVESDLALTAKILSLCRMSNIGIRTDTITVDRAVVLLGFDAIRNAVLSIKVFEVFGEDGDEDGAGEGFDRKGFWRHSLAVAVASEMLAAGHPEYRELQGGEAFVCGLLHDLGKLALDHVLPKSYQRVAEITDQTQGNIAAVEKRVLGLDHHTAGKHLAEHWQLPYAIQDSMWLHDVPYASLPKLDHRRLVGLVGVADLLVRSQHIGYSGNYSLRESVNDRVLAAGLKVEVVENVAARLHEELERRAEALGVGKMPSRELFFESIMQANDLLSRLNSRLEARHRESNSHGNALKAIVEFYDNDKGVIRTVSDVLGMVVGSASKVLGGGYYGMLYQGTGDSQWQVMQYDKDGRVSDSQSVDPPVEIAKLSALTYGDQLSLSCMSVLPWISDYLTGVKDIRKVNLLPLPCSWGTAAVLIHDRSFEFNGEQGQSLIRTWGAAIGAATQHAGAKRLGDELATASRVMAEMQDELLRRKSLASLGEMAAGAAHEMNNPLAVISGRAQLMMTQLSAGSQEAENAGLIFEQAQKLSELITALHLFAEPPASENQSVSIEEVVERAIHHVQQREPDVPAIMVSGVEGLPVIWTDPEQLSVILSELVLNGVQCGGEKGVEIRTQVDLVDGRLVLQVIDDGEGMDDYTLSHAFDPFFSAKAAGRRTGLGLSRARRLIDGLGGDIELRSELGKGTTASLSIPLIDGSGEERIVG